MSVELHKHLFDHFTLFDALKVDVLIIIIYFIRLFLTKNNYFEIENDSRSPGDIHMYTS